MNLTRKTVHTPDDVEHLFIVTRPRSNPVVSLVRRAERHFESGSDYDAVDAEATTIRLHVDCVPEKESIWNSDLVEISVGSDIALASDAQVSEWVEAYEVARAYQARSVLRRGFLYGYAIVFSFSFYALFAVVAGNTHLATTTTHFVLGAVACAVLGSAASTWGAFSTRSDALGQLHSARHLESRAAAQHKMNQGAVVSA